MDIGYYIPGTGLDEVAQDDAQGVWIAGEVPQQLKHAIHNPLRTGPTDLGTNYLELESYILFSSEWVKILHKAKDGSDYNNCSAMYLVFDKGTVMLKITTPRLVRSFQAGMP